VEELGLMKEMQYFCVGMNHLTAPIEVRERCAFDEYQVRAALAHKGCGDWQAASELLILSTCNRTEIYAVANRDIFADLEEFLAEVRGEPLGNLQPYLYRLKRMEAVRHLFEVACGLNSQVLGEAQILGQITRALELARGAGTVGPMLNRLFLAAIHSGKRARSETAICRSSASISSLAAAMAEQVLPDLAAAKAAVLGAGEMAELAVEALRRRGVTQLVVVNRTISRAQQLAQRWGAQVNVFENLVEVLSAVDIVISSTGAPHFIITRDVAAQAMARRAQRPIVLIDIALPRDIDPEIAEMPFVYLYDLDQLNAEMESCLLQRKSEVPRVREIMEQELALYKKYLRSLEVLPFIAQLQQHAEQIRSIELEKTLRHLPDLTQEERKHIDALTRALVKKMLSAPMRRLRSEAVQARAAEYLDALRYLFELDNGGAETEE